MKSIVENILNADALRNKYIQDQLHSMFTKYGPDTVMDSPEIVVADFGRPAENTGLRERLEACAGNPALARDGRSSPFRSRGAPVRNTHGLYVILTDYRPAGMDPGSCKFKVAGLTAIYRGESDKVRERTLGHVFQSLYQASLRHNQLPWPGFMTIDQRNGIDIHNEEYANSRWMVVIYPLPKCGSHVRRQAELAFDSIFGKPAASTN